MPEYLPVKFDENTVVYFEASDEAFVQNHGGRTDQVVPDELELSKLADTAGRLSKTFRSRMAPDELSIELSIGLSGEVGWFFAKSKLDANIKVTVTWKSDSTS